ncbi:hypothetical protein GON26_00475 [Flavobacterium sp. GA093]|uniref:PH domain-containing protein n=1 Tax=Flavobacterium hydrocarbonoxydans TaxID=2683249 RepID=A0A6I4NE64_9FLAO|nr:hypothetical protein [Flavobacterium hydrocarbonoxydans]MWB92830.1 hypothetical protein [Flavobacterium hydrocarbonoxydans]
MTNATKNKIWILLWLLTLMVMAYLSWNRASPLWERLLMISLITFTGILNVSSRIRHDKDIKFCDDTLYIKKTFSKEKKYNLKNILSWSENHYFLLGMRTNRVIMIKTENGEKININKGTKNFESVSDYLNDNFSDKFKKNS